MAERIPNSRRISAEDQQYLADAVQAARRAGAVLRSMFRTRPEGRVKTSLRDLVTEADLAAERLVLDLVRERYPAHAWRSEEAGLSAHTSPFQWVVDPLDGTSNFAHGFPHFCVSIALLHEGRSRVGVVHDPMRGETFTAVAGAGARLNNRRLHVSAIDSFDRAMVTSGFPYEPPAHRSAVAGFSARVIERVQMFRRSGSAALDLAYVAAGRLEAHWEFGLSLHDVAAGLLLVQEAGGRCVEVHKPEYKLGYLASNGTAVHETVEALHGQFLAPVTFAPVAIL